MHHDIRFSTPPAYGYAGPGAYFIIMVSQDRACLFGVIERRQLQLSGRGRIADECWRVIPEHFPKVELGAHMVMPNHVHGIIILREYRRTKRPPVRARYIVPVLRPPLNNSKNRWLGPYRPLSARRRPQLRVPSFANAAALRASGNEIIVNTSSGMRRIGSGSICTSNPTS